MLIEEGTGPARFEPLDGPGDGELTAILARILDHLRLDATGPPLATARRAPDHDVPDPVGWRYDSRVGKLFLLFTLLPLLDLWVLLAVGRALGLWPTVALVVVTGATGAWLAKAEGRRVLRGWQQALERGRVPDEGILSAALVLAGGVLLVTPGVITDAMGLALLLPPTRRLAAAGLRRWLERKIRSGQVRVVTFGHGGGFGDGRPDPAADEPVDVTPRRPGAP